MMLSEVQALLTSFILKRNFLDKSFFYLAHFLSFYLVYSFSSSLFSFLKKSYEKIQVNLKVHSSFI